MFTGLDATTKSLDKKVDDVLKSLDEIYNSIAKDPEKSVVSMMGIQTDRYIAGIQGYFNDPQNPIKVAVNEVRDSIKEVLAAIESTKDAASTNDILDMIYEEALKNVVHLEKINLHFENDQLDEYVKNILDSLKKAQKDRTSSSTTDAPDILGYDPNNTKIPNKNNVQQNTRPILDINGNDPINNRVNGPTNVPNEAGVSIIGNGVNNLNGLVDDGVVLIGQKLDTINNTLNKTNYSSNAQRITYTGNRVEQAMLPGNDLVFIGQGYASGTKNAKKGFASVNEYGPEIIATKKGTIFPF